MAYSFVGFAVLLLAGLALSQKPWDSVERTESWWQERHRDILNSTASQANQIKVVFIGSSSIEKWASDGRQIWDAKYAPLGAINYGIGGDRTEHVIWRIDNGELDGLRPQLVVVYIGSNNVPVHSNNSEIVRGVDTVITKIHEKVPDANILYLGFFPRGDVNPISNTLARIVDITDSLETIVDGDTQRRSHVFDIFSSLAPPSMDRINEEFYQGDKLHLNSDGYALWDRLMNSTFYDLLD
ncbi:unnamed protein product [Orchesella dallaii]|uniref:SGNH hydrolase-type esterase domain-containing protein n=1 Tax=Orchesella dallaii TaxID=48710 RepID=A0ABP1R258_9HEXA